MVMGGFIQKISGVWLLLVALLLAGDGGYFQQYVHYTIHVRLFPSLNRLEGREWLRYVNHSPDTLNTLYFHLYQNQSRINYIATKLRRRGEEPGYQEIIRIRDERGEELPFSLSASLLKVPLPRPLPPGDSLTLFIRFNTVLPAVGERFGYYGDHFDVGNWYPVPAVYDREGWHTDLHLGGEFYQEWGDFRVNITVPRGFVVAATGRLLNPDVLPDSVEYPDREVNYYRQSEDDTVVYRFEASRVHDFAWSADPEFVLRTTYQDGIRIQLFIQPYQLDLWEGMLEVARKTVEWMQKWVGPYPYPVLNVVDGYITAGGIEYPNLVIINDYIQEKRELSATIAHEIIHQWFYGLLANNQTRYGWMDEGLTTYFENRVMEQIAGDTVWVNSPPGFWGKYFGYRFSQWQEDRLRYLNYLRSGQAEPINRHFDWFQNDPFLPYYTGTSEVLTQLRYLLGDSVFLKGMQNYYRKWRFRHPAPEDLRRSFEEVYGKSLHWFFDEWLNTTFLCDYSVEKVQTVPALLPEQGTAYQMTITFRRNEPIAMPLRFWVKLADGSRHPYLIPLDAGENFLAPADSEITPWLFKEKEKVVTLRLPLPPRQVEIDSQLLDANPFNNRTGFLPPVHWYWLRRQYLLPDVDAYTVTLFPFAFYNGIDGVQVGIRTRGNWAFRNYRHTLRLLLGLHSLAPEVDFWLEHPWYALNPETRWVVHLYHGAGQSGGGGWLQFSRQRRSIRSTWLAGVQYRYLRNPDYQWLPGEKGALSTVEITYRQENWDRGFMPRGWEWRLHGESSSFGSQFAYQQWWLDGKIRIPLIWSQMLTVQAFVGGQYGEVPVQKQFRLGGASGYDFWQNPFYRARGTFPRDWWQQGHLFLPGGGNLRWLANEPPRKREYLTSLQFNFTLGNPLNLIPVYLPYLSDILFSGFATLASDPDRWRRIPRLYSEAGVTISITRLPFVLNYFDLERVHLDFLLYTNAALSREPFHFRWIVRCDFKRFY